MQPCIQFALGLMGGWHLPLRVNKHFSKTTMKKLATILLATVLLAFGANTLSAQTSTAPKSVIHVVTVKWKADATPKQIQAALDGVKALPGANLGITRVWIKSIKVQGDKTHAFVMEFTDEAALKAYADSPAQKEWYKVYLPIREESTTFDITN
jgi:hypothetical protein